MDDLPIGEVSDEMAAMVERAKATFRGEYVRLRQWQKTNLSSAHAQDRAWAAVISEVLAKPTIGNGEAK